MDSGSGRLLHCGSIIVLSWQYIYLVIQYFYACWSQSQPSLTLTSPEAYGICLIIWTCIANLLIAQASIQGVFPSCPETLPPQFFLILYMISYMSIIPELTVEKPLSSLKPCFEPNLKASKTYCYFSSLSLIKLYGCH